MNTLKVWIEDSLRTARADIAARNPDAPRRLLP
jgi:hypothetical protein